ncbi:MAG: FHA domain-containing protein [Thermoanaerobaculia bacterium]
MTDVWSYFLEFKDERFELDGDDLTVGRSRTCAVSIKDPSVSRQHVRLGTGAGKVRLTDLGSSNGTFINGERIQGGGELGDGDTLGLGDADIQVRITRKAGFETVRMPRLPAEGGQLPQFGEATGILQKESMRLAKEALGDDLDGSQGLAAQPVLVDPAEAGSHMAPPAPAAAPTPAATLAVPSPPAPPAAGTPAVGEELSFAGVTDEPPDFDLPAAGEEPSFAPPGDELAFEAPGVESPLSTQVFSTPASPGQLRESPKVTIELPTLPPPLSDGAARIADRAGEPGPESIELAPPDLPPLELPEPPVVEPAPVTDVRAPASPPAEALPAGGGEAPPAPKRSGDELLPSLDGFDTTLGPGSPIPESMLRAQENMAKVRAEIQEPLPKLYEQPIQVPPLAGFWVRLVAVLLDDLWMLALSAAGWLGLQELGAAVAGAVSLLVILSGWAIWGTTPGKRLLGLYVCTADGQAGLGVARAVLRLFGYLVSALLLGIGFLMILSSSKRGLHDRIAATYVRRFK